MLFINFVHADHKKFALNPTECYVKTFEVDKQLCTECAVHYAKNPSLIKNSSLPNDLRIIISFHKESIKNLTKDFSLLRVKNDLLNLLIVGPSKPLTFDQMKHFKDYSTYDNTIAEKLQQEFHDHKNIERIERNLGDGKIYSFIM